MAFASSSLLSSATFTGTYSVNGTSSTSREYFSFAICFTVSAIWNSGPVITPTLICPSFANAPAEKISAPAASAAAIYLMVFLMLRT